MEKKLRNNLAKEALQTLQHFHCFLEQQTQIAGWVSLLLPNPCSIPAFAGSTSLGRGGSSPGPAACSCSGAVGAGGVTQAAVTPRHCCCSPAVVLFSVHGGECFPSAVQRPSKRGRQPQPTRGDEGLVSAQAGRVCWGSIMVFTFILPG